MDCEKKVGECSYISELASVVKDREREIQRLIIIIRQATREGYDLSREKIKYLRFLNTSLGIANPENRDTF